MGFLRQVFALYVAVNMLACALLFFPWAKKRETISGLLGRWQVEEEGVRQAVGYGFGWFVDRLYYWDADHCRAIYRQERAARQALYGEG